jgi:hypothetical protein
MNAENRPAAPAPEGQQKEQLEAVLAHAGGRTFEIPMEVAQRYESGDDHDRGGDDEVGGRDRRWLRDGTFRYHSDWAFGPYVWITDGRSYRGQHWHPNPDSPFAYDMDNY